MDTREDQSERPITPQEAAATWAYFVLRGKLEEMVRTGQITASTAEALEKIGPVLGIDPLLYGRQQEVLELAINFFQRQLADMKRREAAARNLSVMVVHDVYGQPLEVNLGSLLAKGREEVWVGRGSAADVEMPNEWNKIDLVEKNEGRTSRGQFVLKRRTGGGILVQGGGGMNPTYYVPVDQTRIEVLKKTYASSQNDVINMDGRFGIRLSMSRPLRVYQGDQVRFKAMEGANFARIDFDVPPVVPPASDPTP